MQAEEAAPLSKARRFRYLVCVTFAGDPRPRTVANLTELAHANGCPLDAKIVSDALRTELVRGRVVRVRRGVYGRGQVPRSTLWWMQACLTADDRFWRDR